MVKNIFLFRENQEGSYEAFAEKILQHAKTLCTQPGVLKIKMTVTGAPPPSWSIIPFKKKKIAILSTHSDQGIQKEHVDKFSGFAGAYQVEEAIPVAYKKSWEDGTATPGVCLLTLFRQRQDLDYSVFLDRWHNSHTPLSLKIHPLWNYNRNVVHGKAAGSEGWDGIVEEQFQSRADLLNPFRFFGNPLVIVQRMIQVYTDTRSFLEYSTIEPYLATEHILKS